MGDSSWLTLWQMAKLDLSEIAPVLLARHPEGEDVVEQAARFAVRAWLEPAETVTAECLRWTEVCISSGQFSPLEKYRLTILGALRRRNLWRDANRLAAQIWEMLGTVQAEEAQRARASWDWERFNPVGAIDARDWPEAEGIVRAEIAARGVKGAISWAAIVAGGSGSPTAPEILRALEENGVDQVDEYGMFGWYILAREAGRAGDLPNAFDALRKALTYWSNPPYWISDLWEQDAYWGNLRDRPEFKQAFAQRRERIGTINGLLHYFPGW